MLLAEEADLEEVTAEAPRRSLALTLLKLQSAAAERDESIPGLHHRVCLFILSVLALKNPLQLWWRSVVCLKPPAPLPSIPQVVALVVRVALAVRVVAIAEEAVGEVAVKVERAN